MTEWNNIDAAGGWDEWNDPYNSDLKLHAAGYLAGETGNLVSLGTWGCFWASSQVDNGLSWDLYFNETESTTAWCWKTFGLSQRCVKE